MHRHSVRKLDTEQQWAEWLTDTPVAFGAAICQRHAPRRILQRRRKT